MPSGERPRRGRGVTPQGSRGETPSIPLGGAGLACHDRAMHTGDGIEQLQRAIRWRTRVAEAVEGHAMESADFDFYRFEDNAQALMQAIWHVKDWLRAGPGAWSKQELEAYAHGTAALHVVRDLAVGSKHLRVDQPKTDASVLPGHVRWDLSSGRLAVDLFVMVDGKAESVLGVADGGIAAWQEFLARGTSG